MIAIARLCVLALCLAAGIAPVLAQDYPTRAVRMIVGFPAGGPTDIVARIIAQSLSSLRTDLARAATSRRRP